MWEAAQSNVRRKKRETLYECYVTFRPINNTAVRRAGMVCVPSSTNQNRLFTVSANHTVRRLFRFSTASLQCCRSGSLGQPNLQLCMCSQIRCWLICCCCSLDVVLAVTWPVHRFQYILLCKPFSIHLFNDIMRKVGFTNLRLFALGPRWSQCGREQLRP